MKKMQQRYLDAQASLQMDWRKVTSTVDSKYVMLDGHPVGEWGWKRWIYMCINKAQQRKIKMMGGD